MYVLVVTGLSGAGKSQALRKLEDMGYYCVDNLPSSMLKEFIQVCSQAQPPIERAALVMDSRESRINARPGDALEVLNGARVDYDVLFLDCRDEMLERRYNETRRTHPLSGHESVKEGIAQERELLKDLRDRASFLVDTTELRPLELSRRLEDLLGEPDNTPFTLTMMSFGYKRGVPFEADMVMDVRFSPNPFYEPELRSLSGLDRAVKDFVLRDPDVCMFLDSVEAMLERLIPRFLEQGKHRLMVAFGCTGGRHRSVCLASEMFERMRGRYPSRLLHRDLGREGAEIRQRFQQAEK